MVLIRRIAEKFLTKEIVNLIENSLSEHDFDLHKTIESKLYVKVNINQPMKSLRCFRFCKQCPMHHPLDC